MAKRLTPLQKIINNARKAVKKEGGIYYFGLSNNDQLWLFVANDGGMCAGGHGNASKPITVKWALNHPYIY